MPSIPDMRILRSFLRQRSLRRSLNSRLNEQFSKDNEAARMHWLVQHLDEYMDRLRGFADLPSFDLPYLLEGDLGFCVNIAVELIDREMRPGSAIDVYVLDVSERLRKLQKDPSRAQLDELDAAVKSLLSVSAAPVRGPG